MDEEARSNIKRALLRMLIRVQPKAAIFDEEDIDAIVRYKMGELTEQEFNTITLRKAALLESQHGRQN